MFRATAWWRKIGMVLLISGLIGVIVWASQREPTDPWEGAPELVLPTEEEPPDESWTTLSPKPVFEPEDDAGYGSDFTPPVVNFPGEESASSGEPQADQIPDIVDSLSEEPFFTEGVSPTTTSTVEALKTGATVVSAEVSPLDLRLEQVGWRSVPVYPLDEQMTRLREIEEIMNDVYYRFRLAMVNQSVEELSYVVRNIEYFTWMLHFMQTREWESREREDMRSRVTEIVWDEPGCIVVKALFSNTPLATSPIDYGLRSFVFDEEHGWQLYANYPVPTPEQEQEMERTNTHEWLGDCEDEEGHLPYFPR